MSLQHTTDNEINPLPQPLPRIGGGVGVEVFTKEIQHG